MLLYGKKMTTQGKNKEATINLLTSLSGLEWPQKTVFLKCWPSLMQRSSTMLMGKFHAPWNNISSLPVGSLTRLGLHAEQRQFVLSQCGSQTKLNKVEEFLYFLFGKDFRTSSPSAR